MAGWSTSNAWSGRLVQAGLGDGSAARGSRIASFRALQIVEFGALAQLPVREDGLGDVAREPQADDLCQGLGRTDGHPHR